ncbi:MAG TPA: CHAD domain-containing protein, partial [Acidimicrobiales bacterium]
DLDVLGMRLRRDAAALDKADADQALRLLRRLDRQRALRLRELHDALDSPRYLALVDTLVDAAREPRFTALAQAPATEVLAELARGPWKQLCKAAAKLGEHPTDDQLHRLRIKTKRARYAAEAAAVAIPEAAAHGEVLAELQGELGELHDAVVAEDWLRREVAAGASRQQALAAGLLIMVQRDEAARRRDEWGAVWTRCSRKKVTGWLG